MKNKKCKCCWGTVIAVLVALLGAAAAVMVLLRRHHTACTEELDDEDLVEYRAAKSTKTHRRSNLLLRRKFPLTGAFNCANMIWHPKEVPYIAE